MLTYLYNKIHPYSSKEQHTKRIQVIIQADIEVSDSVFGDVVVTLIKILMRTKNKVISKVIRPGIRDGTGFQKLGFRFWK